MSNWIQERAAEVRRSEKERKEEFERKLAAAKELKAQLSPFWKALVAVLVESVKEFNIEFSEPTRQINEVERPDEDTILIRRGAYPSVSVKAQVNNAGTSVLYSITRVQKKGANSSEMQASLGYVLTEGKAAYSDSNFISHDDVAKVLLDSFFVF